MKKNTMFFFSIGITVAFTVFSSFRVAAEQLKPVVDITIPSVGQTKIAPDRDFYIIGNITGIVPEDSQLMVTVQEKNTKKIIRKVIVSKKDNEEGMDINHPLLSYYGNNREELSKSLMPDLVYKPGNPLSLFSPWMKGYFTDSNFTAVINNGQSYDMYSKFDQNGKPYVPLAEGEYIISVILMDENNNFLSNQSKQITIGYSLNKVLSRFSPKNHFERILREAETYDYQVFLDPFPGYWSPDSFIPGLIGKNIFAEILPEWRHADLAEYQSGKTHFYVYNVKESSATYNVEVGTLQEQQIIDNPEQVAYYYYKWGEPVLGSKDSPIEKFTPGDSLELTRVDSTDKASILEEGKVVTSNDTEEVSSTGITDHKVSVGPDNFISLSGVVTPIQNDEKDIQHLEDNSFIIGNRINQLYYEVSCEGDTKKLVKPVSVNRVMDNKDNRSVLEFSHLFEIPYSWRGHDITFNIKGLDSFNKSVEGSEEKIIIQSEK